MSKIYLSIDLTPSRTTIFRDGKGIVLEEPNRVLCEGDYSDVKILEFGTEAEVREYGQFLIYPIKMSGVEACDAVYARQMFAEYIHRVTEDKHNANVIAKFVVSCGVSENYIKSLQNLAYYAGISRVDFVPYPLADMIGCGINFDDFLYCMLVDINSSNTDIAILCRDGIYKAVSINIGTQNFEQAIFDVVKYRYGIKLSSETVRAVLNHLGSLTSRDEYELSYSGIDIQSFDEKTKTINSRDIFGAIQDYYLAISKTVRQLFQSQPESVRENLMVQGVLFCGCGSSVPGLRDFMEEKIELPVFVANYDCTLYGLGKLTKDKLLYKKMMKKVV